MNNKGFGNSMAFVVFNELLKWAFYQAAISSDCGTVGAN
jgi:hypothetical protein